MSIEIKGLREAQQKLNEMTRTAEELDGSAVALKDVLDNSFISEHSSYRSFEKLIEASGFKVESQEDFDSIPDDEWNTFIVENSSFTSWQDMINTAGAIYAKKKFDL